MSLSLKKKKHALQPDGDEKLVISKASFGGKRKPVPQWEENYTSPRLLFPCETFPFKAQKD